MDTGKIQQALRTLIDYFEAGNRDSDGAAKTILLSDTIYDAYWRPEVDELQRGPEWTGLRAPEAELLAGLLRRAAELIAGTAQKS